MFVNRFLKCDKKGHYYRIVVQKDLFDDYAVTLSWFGDIKNGGVKNECVFTISEAFDILNKTTRKLTRKNRGYKVIEETMYAN